MPVSMLVFAEDPTNPLARSSFTVGSGVQNLGEAIQQFLGHGYDVLADALVPFAGDPHGWFCFDFSSSDEAPVVFVDSEVDWTTSPSRGFRFVAAAFAQFLALLERPNESGDYPTPMGGRRKLTRLEQDWGLHRDSDLLS